MIKQKNSMRTPRFSPDAEKIAFFENSNLDVGIIKLWNIKENKFIICEGNYVYANIFKLQWTLNGHYIITCDNDGLMFIHDLNGKKINELNVIKLNPDMDGKKIEIYWMEIVSNDTVLVNCRGYLNRNGCRACAINFLTGEIIKQYPDTCLLNRLLFDLNTGIFRIIQDSQ